MRSLRFILLLSLSAALAACAAMSTSNRLQPVSQPTSEGRSVEILVATSRLRGDTPHTFSYGRSHLINFQSIKLSAGPGKSLGSIGASTGDVTSVDVFETVRNEPVSETDFIKRVADAAARGDGEVTLYVHGFNTTHENAVLRLAQIVTDAGTLGAAVMFSWPSRGRVLDYLTDRESAMFSRDRLELVLRQLGRQSKIRRINILAHSMGAFLTMETLRQAKLVGNGEFDGKLNAVVLAAPDIDIDVFRTQLEVIGKRKRPTILLISSDDAALQFSRFLSGDVERVGVVRVDSPEAQAEIARLGLTVIDLTKVRADSHTKFVEVPNIIRHIGTLVGDQRVAQPGGVDVVDETGRIRPFENSAR